MTWKKSQPGRAERIDGTDTWEAHTSASDSEEATQSIVDVLTTFNTLLYVAYGGRQVVSVVAATTRQTPVFTSREILRRTLAGDIGCAACRSRAQPAHFSNAVLLTFPAPLQSHGAFMIHPRCVGYLPPLIDVDGWSRGFVSSSPVCVKCVDRTSPCARAPTCRARLSAVIAE